MTKEIRWTPGTKKDLRELDEDVRAGFGYGLYLVQTGKEIDEIAQAIAGLKVKQLTGYGALVYELKQNIDKDTYRCVYTVRFRGQSMCSTPSRRSQRAASGSRRKTTTLSANT